MKKRMLALSIVVVLLAALSGCTWLIDPLPDPVTEPVVRLLTEGTIYAPRINGMPFGYENVQPGDLYVLDFRTYRDQYGNPAGLSDDTRWTLDGLTVQCFVKTETDTIFHPGDRGENERVVFFGWTAPIEPVSGLPYPLYPLVGYPWNACQTHSFLVMPSQSALVTATAKADILKVEFVCPEMGEPGSYVLDETGATPQEGRIVAHRIDRPGTYIVRWKAHEGALEASWEFDVPIDWFYIDGEWGIPVGPTGLWC